MIGYIRDPRTWVAVKTVTVTNYELPIETAQGETGKVSIVGQLDADYSRYVFSLENKEYVFKITGQQTGNNFETTITIVDSIGILEGYRRLDNMASSAINVNVRADDLGTYSNIAGFKLFSARPTFSQSTTPRNSLCRFCPNYFYITQETLSFMNSWLPTAKIARIEVCDYDETSQYVTIDSELLLREIRNRGASVSFERQNVVVVFKPIVGESYTETYPSIVIDIVPIDAEIHPIFFNDGHSSVISESYNDNICTRAIMMDIGSTVYTDLPTIRFLTDSGEVTTNESEQAKGYTAYSQYDSSKVDADSAAMEIFSKNTRNHKIEFASDKELHIGQPVKLMLSRGVLDTVISKVMLKSGDDRFIYTCGELPVTATERIKADGWSYGSRLPNNPYKGQLFLEV